MPILTPQPVLFIRLSTPRVPETWRTYLPAIDEIATEAA